MSDERTYNLEIWRQPGADAPGWFESHQVKITEHASFLEMLDLLNEQLMEVGKRPVEFDSDCREGICGSCACVINGQAHGPERGTAVCQLHMRTFEDGAMLRVEPWAAEPFPVLRDLVVDRSALDRIQSAGGYVSVNTGPKPDANSMKVGKDCSDKAMDFAACIGCGACVAACPNGSASLFVGARLAQFALLPQGQPERARRTLCSRILSSSAEEA